MSLPLPRANSSPCPSPTRLRSCLSPPRPSLDATSSCTTSTTSSRSPSFSSTCSDDIPWRRRKSVRWKGENGCAVTSYHATYSSTEYDRSPLDPPSQEERDCTLPERGSRCFQFQLDCFSSSEEAEEEHLENASEAETDADSPLTSPSFFHPLARYSSVVLYDEPESILNATATASAVFETSSESIILDTPPCEEDPAEDGDRENHEEDEDEDEDKEWEECMNRRRMMFAHLSISSGSGSNQPEFEGYRSISSTLAEMLKDLGVGSGPGGLTPVDFESSPQPQSREDRQAEDRDEDEDDSTTTFGVFQKIRDAMEAGQEVELHTPELASSAGSEEDCCLATPNGIGIGVVGGGGVEVGVGVEVVRFRMGRIPSIVVHSDEGEGETGGDLSRVKQEVL